MMHGDVIKWKHFRRYWPFVRGIHRWPVNSPHKGQWRRALMFSLICAWINSWVNNGEAGDLRRHRAHNEVIVMAECHGYIYNRILEPLIWICQWYWVNKEFLIMFQNVNHIYYMLWFELLFLVTSLLALYPHGSTAYWRGGKIKLSYKVRSIWIGRHLFSLFIIPSDLDILGLLIMFSIFFLSGMYSMSHNISSGWRLFRQMRFIFHFPSHN